MLILAGVGAGPKGDFESIATTTVGSGGQSTITFSSIPSTYKHLQIRYAAKNSGTSENFVAMKWVYNSDTAANYSNHYIYGSGAATGSAATTARCCCIIRWPVIIWIAIRG